jgi:hypothetical protein
VDFGCGSGGVSLCLAALFPRCTFLLVDPFERSIALAKKQAKTRTKAAKRQATQSKEATRADLGGKVDTFKRGFALRPLMSLAAAVKQQPPIAEEAPPARRYRFTARSRVRRRNAVT